MTNCSAAIDRIRYLHRAQIGTFELEFYGKDDRYVKRVVARWLAIFWQKAKHTLRKEHPWSMAVAINDDPSDPPMVIIRRWRIPAGETVPCAHGVNIEKFVAEPESVREFCRVFGRH